MKEPRRRIGFRWIDTVALGGFLGLSLGAALFAFGANYVPAWLAWLIAPLLWYLGFGMLVGWAVARLVGTSRSHPEGNQPGSRIIGDEAAPSREEPVMPPLSSNFIEHDFLLEKVKEFA